MIRYIVFIVLSLCVISAAQEQGDEMKIYDLQDTIVVVANRYQTTLKNLTYTHQLINNQEVEKLSTHSSLEVVDIFFPSAYTLDKKILGYGVGAEGAGSINLRGQGGKPNTGLLVLINGHPDFMGIFGHPLPDVYSNDVNQVEIIAGPSSTVFGSQAMGGIVNINTRPDYSKFLKLFLEGGSHGTYNIGFNLNKSLGSGGFYLNAKHQHTDGHAQNTGFNSFHFQGGVDIRLNKIWKIGLSGRFVPYEFDDPVRNGTDPAQLGTYAKINRGNGDLIVENKSDILQGSTQIYGNWGHHRF